MLIAMEPFLRFVIILCVFWDVGNAAIKISGREVQLDSSRILENKKSYANTADEFITKWNNAKLKKDEDILLAKLPPRIDGDAYDDDSTLLAAHDLFTKKIYGIGKEPKDYGINDTSEIWTIRTLNGVNEYRIGRHIGSGSFGEAKLALPVGKVKAEDIVVIKTEESKVYPSAIENEKQVYESLKGIAGIPEAGDVGKFSIKNSSEVPTRTGMVIPLLGFSLDKLQTLCGGKFSLPTVLVIAIQMVNEEGQILHILDTNLFCQNFDHFSNLYKITPQHRLLRNIYAKSDNTAIPLPSAIGRECDKTSLERLRAVHARKILHRDIKPGNICINRLLDDRKLRVFNLIDFGLAKRIVYNSATGLVEESYSSNAGTTSFASQRSLQGEPQGPKDDLESLAYTLILLLTGVLQRDISGDISNEIWKELPAEFCELLEYAMEDPIPYVPIEYEKYIAKFREMLAQMGLHESRVELDWDYKMRMLYESDEIKDVGVAYAERGKSWLAVFVFQRVSVLTLFDVLSVARKSNRKLSIDTNMLEVAKIYAESHSPIKVVERSPERITLHFRVESEQNVVGEFQRLLENTSYNLKTWLTETTLFSNVWFFVAFGLASDPITGNLFLTIFISKVESPALNLNTFVAYDIIQSKSLKLTEIARSIAIERTISCYPGEEDIEDLRVYTIRLKQSSPLTALQTFKAIGGHHWGKDPEITEFGFSLKLVEDGTFDLVIVGAKYHRKAKECLKMYNVLMTIRTDARSIAVKEKEFPKKYSVEKKMNIDIAIFNIVLKEAKSMPGNQIGQIRIGFTHQNEYIIVKTILSTHAFHGMSKENYKWSHLYKRPDIQLVWRADEDAADPEISKTILPFKEFSTEPFLVQEDYKGELDTYVEDILHDILDCSHLTSIAVGCAISTANRLSIVVYPVYDDYYLAVTQINLKRKSDLTVFFKNDQLEYLVQQPDFQTSEQLMLGSIHFRHSLEPGLEKLQRSKGAVLYECILDILSNETSKKYSALINYEVNQIGLAILSTHPAEIWISLYMASDIKAIDDDLTYKWRER